jgi:hypothetical protein
LYEKIAQGVLAMKTLLHRTAATLLLTGLLAMTISAQTSAQERADNLRFQLSELEVRQAELQARSKRLEEDLKPENIEQSLAGVGSTRPEELREGRRRQLELAQARLSFQLDELDRLHARLESAIAEADAEAYWQSAGIVIGEGTEE